MRSTKRFSYCEQGRSLYLTDLCRHMRAQGVRAVAAGGQHTVAVTETSVYSWGCNSAGQLGTRTFRDKAAPTLVRDLESAGVTQVACGRQHTLFLCRCVQRF